jgi:hypothetical protein
MLSWRRVDPYCLSVRDNFPKCCRQGHRLASFIQHHHLSLLRLQLRSMWDRVSTLEWRAVVCPAEPERRRLGSGEYRYKCDGEGLREPHCI